LSGKRQLDLGDDRVEYPSTFPLDGKDHGGPVDQDDVDLSFPDGKGDFVHDPGDPRGLVTEKSVGAFDTLLGACIAMRQEERRKR
jgi:hypothetical protein